MNGIHSLEHKKLVSSRNVRKVRASLHADNLVASNEFFVMNFAERRVI